MYSPAQSVRVTCEQTIGQIYYYVLDDLIYVGNIRRYESFRSGAITSVVNLKSFKMLFSNTEFQRQEGLAYKHVSTLPHVHTQSRFPIWSHASCKKNLCTCVLRVLCFMHPRSDPPSIRATRRPDFINVILFSKI